MSRIVKCGMELFIDSQTSTIAPLKLGNRLFHPTLYNGCNYLPMLGIKSIHVSKMCPMEHISGSVKIGSGGGSMSSDNKPLPESMLTEMLIICFLFADNFAASQSEAILRDYLIQRRITLDVIITTGNILTKPQWFEPCFGKIVALVFQCEVLGLFKISWLMFWLKKAIGCLCLQSISKNCKRLS